MSVNLTDPPLKDLGVEVVSKGFTAGDMLLRAIKDTPGFLSVAFAADERTTLHVNLQLRISIDPEAARTFLRAKGYGVTFPKENQ